MWALLSLTTGCLFQGGDSSSLFDFENATAFVVDVDLEVTQGDYTPYTVGQLGTSKTGCCEVTNISPGQKHPFAGTPYMALGDDPPWKSAVAAVDPSGVLIYFRVFSLQELLDNKWIVTITDMRP